MSIPAIFNPAIVAAAGSLKAVCLGVDAAQHLQQQPIALLVPIVLADTELKPKPVQVNPRHFQLCVCLFCLVLVRMLE